MDSNTLSENYCKNDLGESITYNCPNGCKDGACVKVSGSYCSGNECKLYEGDVVDFYWWDSFEIGGRIKGTESNENPSVNFRTNGEDIFGEMYEGDRKYFYGKTLFTISKINGGASYNRNYVEFTFGNSNSYCSVKECYLLEDGIFELNNETFKLDKIYNDTSQDYSLDVVQLVNLDNKNIYNVEFSSEGKGSLIYNGKVYSVTFKERKFQNLKFVKIIL